MAARVIDMQSSDSSNDEYELYGCQKPRPCSPKLKHRYKCRYESVGTTDDVLFEALYDFNPYKEEQLGFEKGDTLELIEDVKSKSSWCTARHLKTKQEGQIPLHFVIPECIWWSNYGRKETEEQLSREENETGTFLVRYASDNSSLALSVLGPETNGNKPRVKHYKIVTTCHKEYCIVKEKLFPNLLALIYHYMVAERKGALCCKLEEICPKPDQLNALKDVEVDRKLVKLDKLLDGGKFGEIFEGTYMGRVVAVKQRKTDKMTLDEFLTEAVQLHQLRHENILQLVGVCTRSSPVLIITEFMINGCLQKYLRNDETRKSLGYRHILNLACQIADGMTYIAIRNVVHGDLRAVNILIGPNNTVRITDLGLAKTLRDGIYIATSDTQFPVRWTAPEAALDKTFSMKSDVWSYGVVLYELITFGKVPYSGMSNKDIITKVDKGYRMERPTDGPLSCPENFYEVMTICWNKEPRNRPTFLYLQSVFDTMYQSEVEEEEYNSRSQRIKRNKNAVDDMNQQCTNPAKRNKNSVVSCKTLTVTECTSKLKVQSIQQMCNTLRPSVSHAGS